MSSTKSSIEELYSQVLDLQLTDSYELVKYAYTSCGGHIESAIDMLLTESHEKLTAKMYQDCLNSENLPSLGSSSKKQRKQRQKKTKSGNNNDNQRGSSSIINSFIQINPEMPSGLENVLSQQTASTIQNKSKITTTPITQDENDVTFPQTMPTPESTTTQEQKQAVTSPQVKQNDVTPKPPINAWGKPLNMWSKPLPLSSPSSTIKSPSTEPESPSTTTTTTTTTATQTLNPDVSTTALTSTLMPKTPTPASKSAAENTYAKLVYEKFVNTRVDMVYEVKELLFEQGFTATVDELITLFDELYLVINAQSPSDGNGSYNQRNKSSFNYDNDDEDIALLTSSLSNKISRVLSLSASFQSTLDKTKKLKSQKKTTSNRRHDDNDDSNQLISNVKASISHQNTYDNNCKNQNDIITELSINIHSYLKNIVRSSPISHKKISPLIGSFLFQLSNEFINRTTQKPRNIIFKQYLQSLTDNLVFSHKLLPIGDTDEASFMPWKAPVAEKKYIPKPHSAYQNNKSVSLPVSVSAKTNVSDLFVVSSQYVNYIQSGKVISLPFSISDFYEYALAISRENAILHKPSEVPEEKTQTPDILSDYNTILHQKPLDTLHIDIRLKNNTISSTFQSFLSLPSELFNGILDWLNPIEVSFLGTAITQQGAIWYREWTEIVRPRIEYQLQQDNIQLKDENNVELKDEKQKNEIFEKQLTPQEQKKNQVLTLPNMMYRVLLSQCNHLLTRLSSYRHTITSLNCVIQHFSKQPSHLAKIQPFVQHSLVLLPLFPNLISLTLTLPVTTQKNLIDHLINLKNLHAITFNKLSVEQSLFEVIPLLEQLEKIREVYFINSSLNYELINRLHSSHILNRLNVFAIERSSFSSTNLSWLHTLIKSGIPVLILRNFPTINDDIWQMIPTNTSSATSSSSSSSLSPSALLFLETDSKQSFSPYSSFFLTQQSLLPRGLTHLSLSHCQNISTLTLCNTGLKQLSIRNSTLNTINIWSTTLQNLNVSQNSILKTISLATPSLQWLDCEGCSKLSQFSSGVSQTQRFVEIRTCIVMYLFIIIRRLINTKHLDYLSLNDDTLSYVFSSQNITNCNNVDNQNDNNNESEDDKLTYLKSLADILPHSTTPDFSKYVQHVNRVVATDFVRTTNSHQDFKPITLHGHGVHYIQFIRRGVFNHKLVLDIFFNKLHTANTAVISPTKVRQRILSNNLSFDEYLLILKSVSYDVSATSPVWSWFTYETLWRIALEAIKASLIQDYRKFRSTKKRKLFYDGGLTGNDEELIKISYSDKIGQTMSYQIVEICPTLYPTSMQIYIVSPTEMQHFHDSAGIAIVNTFERFISWCKTNVRITGKRSSAAQLTPLAGEEVKMLSRCAGLYHGFVAEYQRVKGRLSSRFHNNKDQSALSFLNIDQHPSYEDLDQPEGWNNFPYYNIPKALFLPPSSVSLNWLTLKFNPLALMIFWFQDDLFITDEKPLLEQLSEFFGVQYVGDLVNYMRSTHPLKICSDVVIYTPAISSLAISVYSTLVSSWFNTCVLRSDSPSFGLDPQSSGLKNLLPGFIPPNLSKPVFAVPKLSLDNKITCFDTIRYSDFVYNAILPNLRYVNVTSCPNLPHQYIQHLITGSNNLNTLIPLLTPSVNSRLLTNKAPLVIVGWDMPQSFHGNYIILNSNQISQSTEKVLQKSLFQTTNCLYIPGNQKGKDSSNSNTPTMLEQILKKDFKNNWSDIVDYLASSKHFNQTEGHDDEGIEQQDKSLSVFFGLCSDESNTESLADELFKSIVHIFGYSWDDYINNID